MAPVVPQAGAELDPFADVIDMAKRRRSPN
jgi:hypothetical protein